MDGRNVAWGKWRLDKVAFLPFECSGGTSPLSIQSVGKCGMGFRIVWICVDCCLKLDDGVSELASLEKGSTGVEGKVGTLAADSDAAEGGGLFTLSGRACRITLLNENCGKTDVGAGLIGQ